MTLPADLGVTAFLVALAGGAASFLSPCVIPLLSAYLLFVSGLRVEELKEGDRRVILSTLAFVLGFSAVFALLGAGFSFAGVLVANQRVFQIVSGALLVVLGAIIAGLTAPGFMQKDVRRCSARLLLRIFGRAFSCSSKCHLRIMGTVCF